MKNFSVLELVKKELVGKYLKVRVLNVNVLQPVKYWVKKSKNVTDKQFNGGNPKFGMVVTKDKVIGHHQKFENLKIVNVYISYDYNQYGEIESLSLQLENGNTVDLPLGELKQIDKNLYFLTKKIC